MLMRLQNMDKNEKQKNQNPSTDPTPDTTASHTPDEATKKKGSWQMILTVIAIIAVILIFTLPGERNKAEAPEGDNEEMVDDMDAETGDTSDTEPAATTPGQATGSSIMTPVSEGDFTYQFQGVEWFLTPQDNDTTALAFKFSEFSRRAGSIVAFGNPYRLGQFEGSCTEVDTMNMTASENDRPLSFVRCIASEGTPTEVALFQDASAPERIYAAQRTDGEFVDFFELDITTIVR